MRRISIDSRFNYKHDSSSTLPCSDPSERIDFAFQEALFEFKGLPFSLPYPVPFKLLGDEAKGYVHYSPLSVIWKKGKMHLPWSIISHGPSSHLAFSYNILLSAAPFMPTTLFSLIIYMTSIANFSCLFLSVGWI